MNEIDQINGIETRYDLANFVKGLAKDSKINPSAWENNNLHSFLAAMAAWIEDMDGYFTNQGRSVPATPEWKTLAQMLSAARYYE